MKDGMKVVACVADLIDRSKIAAVADVTFVATPGDIAATVEATGATVVVVDLGCAGVLDVLGSLGSVRVVGFARHTDTTTIAAARAAGCREVLPRSAFFPHVAELLS